jgi:hypothetical protein
METRQVLSFDGIRVAVQIAERAYGRLVTTLTEIGAKGSIPESVEPTEVVEHAWAVVDAIHRLRRLLMSLRGLKQNSPGLQQFYRGTSEIEDLRNGTQHVDEKLGEIEELNLPVWGAISWLYRPDPSKPFIDSLVLVPGPVRTGSHKTINPAGMRLRHQVDHVTLDAFGARCDLTEAFRHVTAVVGQLQAQLAKHADPKNHYGCDFLTAVKLELLKEAPAGPPEEPVSFDGAI